VDDASGMGLRAVDQVRFARGTARTSPWCAENTEKLIGRPAPLTEKFEVVIMIAVTDRVPDLNLDCERAGVGKGNGMAAILRASERRTMVGLIPLASELS
jgi:hypothetical protein